MTVPPNEPRPGASSPGAEALERAREELRRPRPEDAAGWAAFASSLERRLRDVSRPGRPLRVLERAGGDAVDTTDQVSAAGTADTDAGVLRVDERVVTDHARRAVAAAGARLVGVQLVVDAEVTTSASLDLWAPYGADVRVTAEAARAAVAHELAELLGVRCPVHVAVVDVWADEVT